MGASNPSRGLLRDCETDRSFTALVTPLLLCSLQHYPTLSHLPCCSHGEEGEGEPLYSYDARHGSWNLGARWSDAAQFGERAYFQVDLFEGVMPAHDSNLPTSLQLGSSPAELRVEGVRAAEAGVYRCRVDFKVGLSQHPHNNVWVFCALRT